MKLGAPSIVEELSSCSRTVRLQHQLTGSRVEIVIGGSTISLGRADWPDQRFPLPAGLALPARAVVRARQSLGPDSSDLSRDGATVHDVHPPVPPPVVEAPFIGCAALVVVHGLSPDALVTIRNGGGTVIGSAQAEGPRAVVGLSGPVAGGQSVQVVADACGSISSADSPPAETIGDFADRLRPPVLPANPAQCQRILQIAGLRPGEIVVLERDDGTVLTYQASGLTMWARVDPALRPGEALTLHVEAPQRCDLPASEPVRVTVSSGPPGPPRITTPPCPGTPVIGLADLVPSALVRLRRGAEELAVFEAAESSGCFDLAGLNLAVGDHLVVEQALCGIWGPASPVDSIVTEPDPAGDPVIVEPVADCSTVVRVRGVAPGSLVSVHSRAAKGRIGHRLATGDAVDVPVSPPLSAGDSIIVSSDGCAGGIAFAEVVDVPDDVPTITRAVAEELAVDIGQCRIGALIDVRVAGRWAGSAVALDREVRVVLAAPLVERQRVEVTARWCGRSTSGDGRSVDRRQNATFLRAADQGIDAHDGHWHSGMVKAIAPLPAGRALLGTIAAGIWLLQPGVAATSLSDSWPDPAIRCIVADPSTPGRWFAGTGWSLRVSDSTAAQPEVNWRVVPGISWAVEDVLVLPGRGLVMLATSMGVRWTQLNTLAAPTFSSAPLVQNGSYVALALGPDESVIAYGPGRVHVGRFNLATLTWDWTDRTFGTPAGGDARLGEVAASMGFGSLSSSPIDRNRVYLAVEDLRDHLPGGVGGSWFPVLRSDDGGWTWSIPSPEGIRYFKPRTDGEPDRPGIDLGYQAERNLVVAAHPRERDTVLIVGRRNGALGSLDGARTWDGARWPDLKDDNQFHQDSMALVFDPADPSGNSVWAGGDGGAFRSSDLGVSWTSIGNRHLPTLMFAGGDGATWAPTITANPADPDVLIAALQDNGLVYRPGAGREWVSIKGGDGDRVTFVAPDVALVAANDASDLHVATWDGTRITRGGQLVPAGQPPNTFFPIVRRVCHPAYRRAGDLMLAVASENTKEGGIPSGKRVFGLFDTRVGPAETRFRWEVLATMPFDITGLGSWDGRTEVVATTGTPPAMGRPTGHIYRVDCAGGAVTELVTAGLAARGGARWVDFTGPASAVAADDAGVIHSPDLVTWHAAGAGSIVPVGTEAWCLAVDRHPLPPAVYLGRGDGVFRCTDLTGASWQQASNLPARPLVNNAELVVARGRRILHVGTWNWSAWAAELQ